MIERGRMALTRFRSAPGQLFLPAIDRWEKLTLREKRLTVILAVLAGLYLVTTLVESFILDPYEEASARKKALEKELVQASRMATSIRGIQKTIQERSSLLGSDNAGFSLISFLEQEARHSRISTSVSQMTPRNLPAEGGYPSVMVSLHLEKVDLAHVLIFIARIQRAPHLLRITHISIERRFDQHDLLDVRLDVQSIQPS